MSLNELSLLAHGCVFDTITRDTFKEISVPIPPLSAQRRLAAVLGSLDDKIEFLRLQNDTLESLAEAAFRGRLLRGPTKPARLGDLADIATGKSLPKSRLSPDGAFRVLGAGGPLGRSDDWLFDTDLVFTGRVGTLGRIELIRAPERVWLSENTLVLTSARRLHLVYFLLKSINVESLDVGSTQPLLRVADLADLRLRVPSEWRMDAFERLARPLFTKMAANGRQAAVLSAIRDGLLPSLTRGRSADAPELWEGLRAAQG